MTIEEMKKRKRELGYTNEDIARISSVPIGTVQKIFSGETRSPRYETIQKLEKVLSNTEGISDYSCIGKSDIYMAESVGTYTTDYYGYVRQQEGRLNKIHKSEYSPVPAERRIGIAAGRFKVPDDSYFYDDELAELFEEA